MAVGYASKALDYIVHPLGEETNPRKQEENGFCARHSAITTRIVQEIAMELQKQKVTRSSKTDLEREKTEFIANENAIIAVLYNHPDNRVKHKFHGTHTWRTPNRDTN